MITALYVLIALSGLIEAATGVWLIVAGTEHPFLKWFLLQAGGMPEGSGPIRFLVFFAALACFLAAGLHFLIWRWLRRDREEAYQLLNLYGVFALLGGIALFMAAGGLSGFGASGVRGSAALVFPGWIFLVLDSLRGALLVAVSNIARFSPNTLRELRLPGERGRARQDSRRPRVSSHARRGGRRRTAPASRSAAGATAAAPSAASSTRSGTATARGRSATDSSRRRPRGSRSRTGAGTADTSEREGREDVTDRPRDAARAAPQRAPRATRSRPSSEGRGETGRRGEERREDNRSDRRRPPARSGERSSAERPRRAAAKPPARERHPDAVTSPSVRPQERGSRSANGGVPSTGVPKTGVPSTGIPSAPSTTEETQTPIEWSKTGVGGRRIKGRYSSSGARFRPRPKRLHQSLGGGSGHETPDSPRPEPERGPQAKRNEADRNSEEPAGNS